MYAHITTDADGHLHPGSTCTIDGQTVPVRLPPNLPTLGVGLFVVGAIVNAIAELGWRPVDYYGTLTKHDGYVQVQVERLGAGT